MSMKNDYPIEYAAWQAMNARVYIRSKKPKDFGNAYRGIEVCRRWRRRLDGGEGDFFHFLDTVGTHPTTGGIHTLDRIDPACDYQPNNVKWLPKIANMSKQRPIALSYRDMNDAQRKRHHEWLAEQDPPITPCEIDEELGMED